MTAGGEMLCPYCGFPMHKPVGVGNWQVAAGYPLIRCFACRRTFTEEQGRQAYATEATDRGRS